MNLRTLGGPLLAFASAAVMLGVIAGLAAFLISGNTLPGDDDFIIGEYGSGGPIRGPMPTPPTKALASSYPFDRYFELPMGSRELDIEIHSSEGSWTRQFLLKDGASAEVREMQRQAEANGLDTVSAQAGQPGFSFIGSGIRGAVQLLSESDILLIVLLERQVS